MACMEHLCYNCNHVEFNNLPDFGKTGIYCPKCGSTDSVSTFDEPTREADNDNCEDSNDTD